ncbi:hypothetical protein AtEden1_Chr1g0023841 [Arabidopsis thaliana]
MSSSSSQTSRRPYISAALNSRSNAAKTLNELIKIHGLEFAFKKNGVKRDMERGCKSALADEYVSNNLHNLRTQYLTKVINLFRQKHHVAEIIKTSWTSDDGKAQTYDIIEVIHYPTNERLIADIDMYDGLHQVMEIPENLEKDVPVAFVGTGDDIRRLVATISDEGVEEALLSKWLARNGI